MAILDDIINFMCVIPATMIVYQYLKFKKKNIVIISRVVQPVISSVIKRQKKDQLRRDSKQKSKNPNKKKRKTIFKLNH